MTEYNEIKDKLLSVANPETPLGNEASNVLTILMLKGEVTEEIKTRVELILSGDCGKHK